MPTSEPWSGHVPAEGNRIPTTTYRLQMGPQFTFDQAREILPYLEALGITDIYLSPVLTAVEGSTHGYDVVDHTRISEAMGGRAGLEALAADAHGRGMGVVVDVVPNHMAVPTPVWHNRALWSVLLEGADSPYAHWFDIDLGQDDDGILMPVLGQRIGTVLAEQQLEVTQEVVPGQEDAGPQPILRYFDHAFPIIPGTEHLPLAELVERQHYRLAYWKVADEELNYRRFFDVGTLAAVRVEDPDVFDATHAPLLELMDQGVIDGLRIDHPDGLADPRGYFRRLHEATGGRWVVAEKILEADEELPGDWPVSGTTGYDTSWRVGALQVDPAGAQATGALMNELTGDVPGRLSKVIDASKRQIVESSLWAEVHRVANLAADLCHDDVRLRDHTFRSILDCVTELVVAVDRYRAYVVPGEPAPALSQQVMDHAVAQAEKRLVADRHETLHLLRDLLLGNEVGSAGRTQETRRGELVIRFQQVCGAVMAKGVEDTAFYRWTHLTSQCEVGGAPARFGIGADEFHAWVERTGALWPVTMTNATTHDTKRGEDVRARISVISHFPTEWVDLVGRLREASAEQRPGDLDGRAENLLWQTLAGTWTPTDRIDAERLRGYLTKAVREQKTWTTWTETNEVAEAAFLDYATFLLTHEPTAALLDVWVELTQGAVRSVTLVNKALQLTVLGVADVYQGTEITRTSLVDPDNRREVDYEHLSQLLASFEGRTKAPGSADLDSEKLWVTSQIAKLRRRHPKAFASLISGYQPLPTSTGHVVAFARTQDGEPKALTVAERVVTQVMGRSGWRDHTVVLPEGRWTDVLTGQTYDGGSTAVADLLDTLPVAVLEHDV